MSESLFLIKLQAETCNVIKKETLAQVFSCEFCEIFRNILINKLMNKLPCVAIVFSLDLEHVLLAVVKLPEIYPSMRNHYQCINNK